MRRTKSGAARQPAGRQLIDVPAQTATTCFASGSTTVDVCAPSSTTAIPNTAAWQTASGGIAHEKTAAFVATAASLRYVDGDRVVLDLARAPATPVEDALAVLGLCATLGLRHATDAQGRSPCCGGGT